MVLTIDLDINDILQIAGYILWFYECKKRGTLAPTSVPNDK